jgi:phosphate transport system permease protein
VTATDVTPVAPEPGEDPRPRRIRAKPSRPDRVFFGITLSGGLVVLAITISIGLFLSIKAAPALGNAKFSFLTTQQWQPDVHRFGIAAVLTGTITIALVALVVSFPLALGTAIFISEIAPRRIKQSLVFAIDLMAAIPSVIYGLWGLEFFEGHAVHLARWLATWLGWIPLFHVPGAHPDNPNASGTIFSASAFIAGVVVAFMMLPIQCAIMREAFSQAPAGEREGAYALGATRWGMIRSVVLPFGKGGIIGGTILGLGRALGETIAVLLIISPVFRINTHILENGSNSVAALIASYYSEASGFGLSALMAAGLALFVLTMMVNFIASSIVARSRSGALSEG